MNENTPIPAAAFRIFRTEDAGDYSEIEQVIDSTPVVAKGIVDFYAAGGGGGVDVKLLFAGSGFSLVRAWFKSGFPLARHSHNEDCLYYILSGSAKVGTDVLFAGDGFFVGKDMPYTHTAGEQGLEVLEFRNSERFTTKFLGAQPYWDRALATIAERCERWGSEARPAV